MYIYLTTEVFGSNGSVRMTILSVISGKSVTLRFLMHNLNLGIAKMSVIPENPVLTNPVQWTPLNRATSGPTLYVSNKRLQLLSGGLI